MEYNEFVGYKMSLEQNKNRSPNHYTAQTKGWLTMVLLTPGAESYINPGHTSNLAETIRSHAYYDQDVSVIHDKNEHETAVYVTVPVQADDLDTAVSMSLSLVWLGLEGLGYDEAVQIANVKASTSLALGTMSVSDRWTLMGSAGHILDNLEEERHVFAQADFIDFI